MVRGKINKEIARELGTTEQTIKAHRLRVMEKIQAASLAELVMIAERLGLLASAEEQKPPDGARAIVANDIVNVSRLGNLRLVRGFGSSPSGWGLTPIANGKRIIVLDDDTSVLGAVKRVLNAHGFGVEVFDTVEGFLSGARLRRCVVPCLGHRSEWHVRNRIEAPTDECRSFDTGHIHHGW